MHASIYLFDDSKCLTFSLNEVKHLISKSPTYLLPSLPPVLESGNWVLKSWSPVKGVPGPSPFSRQRKNQMVHCLGSLINWWWGAAQQGTGPRACDPQLSTLDPSAAHCGCKGTPFSFWFWETTVSGNRFLPGGSDGCSQTTDSVT